MKCNYICLLCLVFMLCYPPGFIGAQELQPPVWSVGDWWVVKSQVYDSGQMVRNGKPKWLPPQTWRFDVEKQDSIENQAYFVVAIRPGEDNPYPYWFRYWFRFSDRYVGRYEMYHPDNSSRTRSQKIGPSVVRKDFAPNRAAPFLTTKFPALPITLPLFGVAGERTTFAVKESTISSEGSSYTSPEFETIQEIEEIDTGTFSEKVNPDFLGSIGNVSKEGNKLIRIQTKSSLQEVQNWDPQLPWCVYGKRVENSILFKRYWLVDVGND